MNQFLNDVIKGLSAPEKFLESKYFYDAKGDVLFQKIMACKDYYPTRCENEIFTTKTAELAELLLQLENDFDVVELGAGDATKSLHLLKELLARQYTFTYYPVDISGNIIRHLQKNLPKQLPKLAVVGLEGEYLKMLEKAKKKSTKLKVVLFLGGNIGNVPREEAGAFCSKIREHLLPGDMLITGFDLKKDPATILAAYNDSEGLTREFNLNLLHRINSELNADFHVNNFYHFPTYDPGTGACKSYLVSKEQQQVNIADTAFSFAKGEGIFMEIAQKYTVPQTDELALSSGFEPVKHFFDSSGWFLDAVWRCK